jgi:hypothetical protein
MVSTFPAKSSGRKSPAFCALAPLLFLVLSQSAAADTLSVGVLGAGSFPAGDCSGTGTNPETVSCSENSSSLSGSGFATYSSLGASTQVTGNIAGGWENYWLNTGILGGSSSTSYVIQENFSLTGTYNYSTENLARIEPNTQVVINGQNVLNDNSNDILYCNNGSPTCAPGSGRGTISTTLQTTPVTLKGGQDFTFLVEFNLTVQCSSLTSAVCNATGDFGDPAIIDFVITNPTTGLPVSGVTVTGDDGTVYAVNTSSGVPEPSSAGLLTVGLLGVVILSARKRFQGITMRGVFTTSRGVHDRRPPRYSKTFDHPDVAV